jgi:hypothetical protein
LLISSLRRLGHLTFLQRDCIICQILYIIIIRDPWVLQYSKILANSVYIKWYKCGLCPYRSGNYLSFNWLLKVRGIEILTRIHVINLYVRHYIITCFRICALFAWYHCVYPFLIAYFYRHLNVWLCLSTLLAFKIERRVCWAKVCTSLNTFKVFLINPHRFWSARCNASFLVSSILWIDSCLVTNFLKVYHLLLNFDWKKSVYIRYKKRRILTPRLLNVHYSECNIKVRLI